MKKNKKLFSRPMSIIATTVALVFITTLNAQAPPLGGTDVDDTTNDSIPLDGGLGILVLCAAAFGIKKLRDNKKH